MSKAGHVHQRHRCGVLDSGLRVALAAPALIGPRRHLDHQQRTVARRFADPQYRDIGQTNKDLARLVVPVEPVDDLALQAAVDHAAQAVTQRASELVETVAAYRDRWNVAGEELLGAGPVSDRTRQRDHRRARTALDQLVVAHPPTPIEASETEPAPSAQRTHTR